MSAGTVDPSGATVWPGPCPHVYHAINAVTAAMAKEGLGKNRKNEQQGYRFRGIDDVYNVLSGILARERLCILPRVVERTAIERPTKTGGISTYTILLVDFDLVSALDGSKHTIRTVGEAMDTADKSSNKAQSAAMKYACLIAFQIPTEGDNDADAQTLETALARSVEQHWPTWETKHATALKAATTVGELQESWAAAADSAKALGAPSDVFGRLKSIKDVRKDEMVAPRNGARA